MTPTPSRLEEAWDLPSPPSPGRQAGRPMFIWASAVMYIHLKTYCFCLLLGWPDYISLLFSLIITATKIYVALKHFEIVFKFNLVPHQLLFIYLFSK
jgi:hypothetical protein